MVPPRREVLLDVVDIFPNERCVVARGRQPRPDAVVVGLQVRRRARRVRVAHVACIVRVAAREEGRARWPADGLHGRVIDKVRARLGDAREVGHEGEAVLLIIVVEIIGEYEDDVRLLRGGRRRERGGEEARGEEQDGSHE